MRDPNKYDWNLPSKAVIACDGNGQGCVLYTAGPHVAMDMHEIGRDLADLGLDDAPAGLSVWEGTTIVVHVSHEGEQDTELRGAFRALTDDEWVAVRAGRCPWDEEAWIKAEEQCGQCGATILGYHACQGVPGGFTDDDPYEGSFREAADNEGARIAAESHGDDE